MVDVSAKGLGDFCRGGFPKFRWDLLGFAFARTWLSYCLFFAQIDVGKHVTGLPGDAVLLLAGSVVVLLFLLASYLARRYTCFVRGLCPAAIVTGAAGALLVWLAASSSNVAFTAAALPFLGASAGFIQVLWCVAYARLSLSSATLYSLYSMLLAAVLIVLTNPHVYGVQASTFVFVPAFALVLLYCDSNRDNPYESERTCASSRLETEAQGRSVCTRMWDDPAARSTIKLLALVVAARFLYALIYNFIITVLASAYETSDVGSYAATSIAILFVLAVVFVKRDKFDPVPLYRMVFPCAVVGFAVIYLFFKSSTSMAVSMSLLGIGYKIFDLMYWLMLFKISKLRPSWTPAVMVFGVCVNYMGMGFGRMAAALVTALGCHDELMAEFVIVSCCVLVVASVLILPDRFVSGLWREGMSQGGGQEADAGPNSGVERAGFELAQQAVAARYGLSDREREVFALLAQGRSQPYIAADLSIARGTVHAHVSRIYGKLGVNSQDGLIDMVEREMLPNG